MEKTIFQEISDTYPTLTETEIRNMLAAFLFTGDAETPSENAIMKKGLDVHADVLKMGHHAAEPPLGKRFWSRYPRLCA